MFRKRAAMAMVSPIGLALILLLQGIFVLWPELGGRLFPVVRDFEVRQLSVSDAGEVTMSGQLRKVRNCDFIGMQWYAMTGLAQIERVPLIRVGDQPPGTSMTRAKGTQNWGPWTFDVHAYPGADGLRGFAEHNCGMPTTTKTLLTTVRIR